MIITRNCIAYEQHRHNYAQQRQNDNLCALVRGLIAGRLLELLPLGLTASDVWRDNGRS